MRIKLLSSAIEDLYEGRLFYEKQGQGLGEYFFDSLFSDIDSLTLYGGIHPKSFGYHRLLSKRFPYAIYYRMEDESVVVWRVLDLRRYPRKIRESLKHGRTTSEASPTE
jgi:plasmid stabilization system protein ParE